jgi:hypothetical protein
MRPVSDASWSRRASARASKGALDEQGKIEEERPLSHREFHLRDLPLPARFIVVRMDSWRSPFRKPIRAVRGAEVYGSARRGTVFAR